MGDAKDAWTELSLPWRVAFEEAWTSWKSGSAGVGSVVIDGDGAIISRGRSRVFDTPDGNSALAGTFMAHAEMNALALLPTGKYSGYTLLTTFEPCLMCAGAIRLYRMPHVAYAADDPVWDGLYDLFRGFPAIALGLASRTRFGGPWGAFAHVLHLSFLVERAPDHVVDAHDSLARSHLALARHINDSGRLEQLVANGGNVEDAAQALWPELIALAQEQ